METEKWKGCESDRVKSQLSHLFNQQQRDEDNLIHKGKAAANENQGGKFGECPKGSPCALSESHRRA